MENDWQLEQIVGFAFLSQDQEVVEDAFDSFDLIAAMATTPVLLDLFRPAPWFAASEFLAPHFMAPGFGTTFV